jgi:C4-dicarboxylate transporter DctM subunit
MFSAIDKYALLAVPFFIFAGNLMGRGGVSARLVRWVTSMIGGIRGSLPFASLGTAAVFSAISGSTAATVAAVGGLTYDRLRKAGYDERFSSGLLISAGAIDNLIPPSIGFILYGIASETLGAAIHRLSVAPRQTASRSADSITSPRCNDTMASAATSSGSSVPRTRSRNTITR